MVVGVYARYNLAWCITVCCYCIFVSVIERVCVFFFVRLLQFFFFSVSLPVRNFDYRRKNVIIFVNR